MNVSEPIPRVAGDSDALVAEMLEEITKRLQAGEPLDFSAILDAHPDQAERLRRMLPALEVLADLGRSAGRGLAPLPVAGGETSHDSGFLGDFRILREVGRGGMGVVYEAEQISLGRRVALKVLPFAATLDPVQLQRFHNEAHAAAQLHHQHIVPVYTVGAERGVHFYAMQFIEGQSLAALIGELRREAGKEGPATGPVTAPYTPSASTAPLTPAPLPGGERGATAAATPPVAGLSTDSFPLSAEFYRAVAKLGIEAADALEHAHQLGVIHRDVKPGNLMLDVRGNLWVTDFGLAQVQTDSKLTMTGDLLGTLRYMSPEQALGKASVLDQRTDIYSLGATLYELLTLEPAVAGRDREEVLRHIAFEESRPLRRHNKSVPPELETIVLKAMAKEAAERYQSAQDLADDLRRYLEDRPIRARRPGSLLRLRKWARRHRSWVAAGVVLLAVVSLGATVSALLFWSEKERAERGEASAEENLKVARANEEFAREQEGLAKRHAEDARKQQLRAEANLQRALKLTGGASRIVHALRSADRRAEAELAYREIIAFWESLLLDSPANPKYQRELANHYWRLAEMLKFFEQPRKAADAYRQAAAGYSKLVPKGLLTGPEIISDASNWGEIHRGMADMLRDSGQAEEAEKAYHENFRFWERLQHDSPNGPWLWQLAQARTHLGTLLAASGHRAEAEGALRQALALQQQQDRRYFAGLLPLRALAETQYALGGLLWDMGQKEDAEKAFVEARWKWHGAMRGEQVAWLLASCPHPKVRDVKQAMSTATIFAERADAARRRPDASWHDLRAAGFNRRTLGVAYYRAGDARAAVAALMQAMELRRGGDASERFFLAMALWKLDQPKEARQWYVQAVRWQEQNQPFNDDVRRFRAEAAELLGIQQEEN
jgi:serine/threonine protein kinase